VVDQQVTDLDFKEKY